jgi:peroxiredoxin
MTTIGRAGTQVGNPAPDFQLPNMDGATISLADLRGNPAVIVFWAAWCSSCKEEAPRINALAAEYAGKGVRVLGINVRDSLAGAEGGVKEFGIRYPVARDADASVARAYNVRGTPTIIFLDRKGVVRYFANELPNDYARRLDDLLAGNI